MQTYQELRGSQSFQKLGESYRAVAGDVNGRRVTIGTFKTLEEASNSYKEFKLNVLTELFNIYQDFLPAHFCDRFQAEVLNCDLR